MDIAKKIFNDQHNTSDLIDFLVKVTKLMKMIKLFGGFV